MAGVGLRRRHSASGTVVAPPAAAPPSAPAPPPGAAAPPEAAPAAAPSAEVAEAVAPAETAAPPEAVAPPEPVTYRSRLGKARGLLSGYLGSIRAKSRVDSATWDDLEEALIRADVGVKATDALLEDLRGRVKAGEITGPDALVEALKTDLVGMLASQDATLAVPDGADGGHACRRLAVRRSQRRRQDHHRRQGRSPALDGRIQGAACGGRHVPGRGGRAARDVGVARPARTSCEAPRAATPARWSSTRCSAPHRGGTQWCSRTPPAGSTTRSTSSRS